MGIPDQLTCLLRNLYEGQETAVIMGYGMTVYVKIAKGVRQSYIMSPWECGGASFKTCKQCYHMIQQSHTWAYIQRRIWFEKIQAAQKFIAALSRIARNMDEWIKMYEVAPSLGQGHHSKSILSWGQVLKFTVWPWGRLVSPESTAAMMPTWHSCLHPSCYIWEHLFQILHAFCDPTCSCHESVTLGSSRRF